MTSINTDKYFEYAVPFHGNETHAKDEFNPSTDGAIADPEVRHRDKVLDAICDLHPSAPMCKVYDD